MMTQVASRMAEVVGPRNVISDPAELLVYESDDEYAISRPCVVRDADGYRMWFAARGDRYRIGYAESDDGIEWRRDDAPTLGMRSRGVVVCR